jgi:hypothetical protein
MLLFFVEEVIRQVALLTLGQAGDVIDLAHGTLQRSAANMRP